MSATLPIATNDDRRPSSDRPEFDLIGMLLEEQQSLSAVERFSALHDDLEDGQPAQAKFYESLLPATAPAPGQQYSFQVDLDACSGCKACVVACHTMNGLEEDESWRRVGTVTIGGDQPRIQHVTTACHHCEEPGCLEGCPVKAYDKDPETGIVRHLDDQCIGCKYCTMMCPYEVPQYSDRLGIVRKCDMCHQRLSVGEAPACVQSCPNEAISIRLVETGVQKFGATDRLAPGAPLSQITRPTTAFVNPTSGAEGSGLPDDEALHDVSPRDALPHDAGVDEVAESHWPLAIMLVATQISVGMLVIERLWAAVASLAGSPLPIEVTRWNASLAFAIAMVGMNLAPLHLGKPLRAWRVFLGLRTSWLSREAVVLGQYVGLLSVALALLWLPMFENHLPEFVVGLIPSWAASVTLVATVLCGLAGLWSSAMIYIATRRTLWRIPRTAPRFFGTGVICGAAWAAVAMVFGQAPAVATCFVILVGLLATLAKLDWEYRIHLGPGNPNDDGYDVRSRRLVMTHLAAMRQTRLTAAAVGTVLLAVALPAAVFAPGLALAGLTVAAIALTLGESCERLLYFSSVVYDRMPGILR